ncbi:anthranilate synthase component I family protein [Salinibacterium hongtaonis]|uniref:Aminodeoxychorismate synthase component I n=1 Tax=Homoserinimonas hongtaonis TaxID=2079791 RepID=A0A2U1SZ33_9MICO|nr:anthranilate synthase component I family protein [Salinibacterium hongtaonis]PWB96869.1 aminodeoxychorismate synthase component I [Salinibacterium hongtaonis]
MRRRVMKHPLGEWIDPSQVFLALFADAHSAFWLDSGIDASSGRSAMGASSRVLSDAQDRPILEALSEELRETRAATEPGADGFGLGWVGWLGYELRGQTLGVEVKHRSEHPDAAWMFVDRAVVFDHAARTVALVALVEANSDGDWWGELAGWRDEVCEALAGVERRPVVIPTDPALQPGEELARWHSEDARYLDLIAQCQAHISAGNAYQLCLTNEARVPGDYDPLASYLTLRATSPAHHGGYLRVDGVALLSASPEQFLAVSADGEVTTRPIKGTRPRASGHEEDSALAAELLASEKERAENLMIVDLMRNDLARVCDPATVRVTSLLAVESYPHVHQLVSTIEGRLRRGLDSIEAVRACFPAGSMTGAPKREATLILDSLEARPRGIYSGVFGLLCLDGSLDLAMVIRSIVIDANGATIGAGGGITALSDPHEELAEVKLKARALLRAVTSSRETTSQAEESSVAG